MERRRGLRGRRPLSLAGGRGAGAADVHAAQRAAEQRHGGAIAQAGPGAATGDATVNDAGG